MNQRKTCVNKRFELLETLGDGSYSCVWKAKDLKSGQFVAVKIINKYQINSQIMSQINQEFQILRSLNHSNIVKCLDKFEDQHHIYLILEYVNGIELFQKIQKRRSCDEIEARKIAHSLLQSIKYIHDRNIIHRDLKPENILIVQDSKDIRVKVIDFGLAVSGIMNEDLTMFCGTPEYMAPEIVQQMPYGKSADVWSVGVILYCLMTGSLPFTGSHPDEIFDHILTNPVLYPKFIWDHISNDAMNLVKGLLAKHPRQRFTIDQALQHPWFQMTEEQIIDRRNQTQQRIKAGIHRARLRKVVTVLRASGYLKRIIAENKIASSVFCGYTCFNPIVILFSLLSTIYSVLCYRKTVI
jgi:serine/threonine protein kinase